MSELQTLRQSLRDARVRSDLLFQILRPGALYERAVAERHRFIFYLGHLDAFDWNLLGVDSLKAEPFHAEWDQLFAFGIDPESTDLPVDGPEDWPGEARVRSYVAETRRRIDDGFDALPSERIHVAIEHRLMHLETLAYLLHNLDYAQKCGQDEPMVSQGVPIDNPFVSVPAGIATLGQEQGAFGWDNEFLLHQRSVPAFHMQKHKVTNGEYLPFVDAGASPPHFWMRRDGEWRLRCMFSEVPLPLDWPVWVTQQEAVAYAAWKNCRLPKEEEFQRASHGTTSGVERSYPWGEAAPEDVPGNFHFRQWNPCPVNATPEGDSAFGISQLVGNGWEWTTTPFGPFEGFQAAPFYPGYSANFFDDKHYVLKGASPRTAAPLLRRSFRNWFRGEYQYAFAGFRCVSDD